MSFLNNFSPVGNNARAGNAPQLFSFITIGDISDLSQKEFDSLKGYARRGDWVDVAEDVGVSADDHHINFFLGDGSSPCALSGTIISGGTGYGAGEIITVTYVGATMIYETNFFVFTEAAGVVTEIRLADPGLWDPENPPDGYTGLATTASVGGSGLTLDITPSNLAGLGSVKGKAGLFGPVTLGFIPRLEAV